MQKDYSAPVWISISAALIFLILQLSEGNDKMCQMAPDRSRIAFVLLHFENKGNPSLVTWVMQAEPQIFSLSSPSSFKSYQKKSPFYHLLPPTSDLRRSAASNKCKHNREDRIYSAACRDPIITMNRNVGAVMHCYKNVLKNCEIFVWDEKH